MGIFILPGRGDKTRVGPRWLQGTGVCGGLRWARRGERSATRDRRAFLHVASSSSSAAAEKPPRPPAPTCGTLSTPGGGTARRPPSDLGKGGVAGGTSPPSPPREGRVVREGAGRSRGLGAGRYPEPGRGGGTRRQPRRHLHSVRDQQAAVDHHLRKEIQLERRSHAGLRGRRGGRREDAAGRGGSHNCAGRRSGRHRCGGLPAAAASPGSCHISLPLSVFSANPLRNRLLRQLSVERQVLSGEAEPSPRCGSPLTPAPPPPRERPIAAAGPGAARPGLLRSARPGSGGGPTRPAPPQRCPAPWPSGVSRARRGSGPRAGTAPSHAGHGSPQCGRSRPGGTGDVWSGSGCRLALHSNSCHSDLGSVLNARSDVTGWRESGSNSVLADQKEGFE